MPYRRDVTLSSDGVDELDISFSVVAVVIGGHRERGFRHSAAMMILQLDLNDQNKSAVSRQRIGCEGRGGPCEMAVVDFIERKPQRVAAPRIDLQLTLMVDCPDGRVVERLRRAIPLLTMDLHPLVTPRCLISLDGRPELRRRAEAQLPPVYEHRLD